MQRFCKDRKKDSAGYDLWVAENRILKPYSRVLIEEGLQIAFSDGYYGRVTGLLAFKLGICAHNGTIDLDYRGVQFNFSSEEYIVKKGNCIAQLIFEQYFTPKFAECIENEFAKEENTERGTFGFGSTGVF